MPTTITGTDGVSQVQTGAVESGDLPAGSVIQVVEESTYTRVETTGNAFIDSGVSATITPSSSSSKIFILLSHHFSKDSANTYAGLRLLRNNTDLGFVSDLIAFNNTTQVGTDFVASSFLDFPNTTSELTYKTQFNNQVSSGTVSIQSDASGANERARGSIVLMEIAG